MKSWDLASPDYDRWLIAKRSKDAKTAYLLRMLMSRDVRAETYREWRAERCNPAVDYTDNLDRIVVEEVLNLLEERIDLPREAVK